MNKAEKQKMIASFHLPNAQRLPSANEQFSGKNCGKHN
jgi:hypothetical protein